MLGWGPLHCFVALCGGRTWRGDNATAGFLRFAQHSPCAATGALLLNPREGGSVYILSSCSLFKWRLLKICQFLPLPRPPLFLQPEVMGIYLPCAGTLDSVVWNGVEIPHSQGIPPDFYPPPVNVGPPILPPPLCATLGLHTSPPISASLHLPVSMNVPSLSPWLLNFHIARFSDVSGYYLF